MCALGLALSPADSGDQDRVRRLNEFHGHQICRTLPVRQKERWAMVPLASVSASGQYQGSITHQRTLGSSVRA